MTALVPAATGPSRRKKPKAHAHRGPIRNNLEAFGVAILAAVLLKWFCLEAYQIPTSSMQPTLMGSKEAGVYDRILVDKIRYVLVEPERWDVTVFRYPLQKNQNYVKRCVGLPGERLHIAGGNLHLVTDQGEKRSYQVLRKPDRIQAGLWKEVFPARMRVRGEAAALGGVLSASPSRAWSEAEGEFAATLEAGRTARLAFQDDADGGLVDRVWDGYPQAVAKAIRDETVKQALAAEIVPDVKFAAEVTALGTLDQLAFEIEVVRPGKERVTFALELQGGQGRLVVRQGGGRNSVAESPAFPCALPAGEAVELAFCRLDDELIAWRQGEEVQRLDVAAFATREGCELRGPQSTADQRVNAQLVARGNGKLSLRDLRIWRDQHWTRSTLEPGHVIEVPAGHYFMMGDNTLQSVDARDWTAIVVGVLPNGTMVPPETPGARVVRGNKRPVPVNMPPDRDETPVVFPDRKELVMIDEVGEILRLKTGISPAYCQADPHDPHMNTGMLFERLDSQDGRGDWRPPEVKVQFVPREHIIGRALLVFWPTWPFGPHRLGLVR